MKSLLPLILLVFASQSTAAGDIERIWLTHKTNDPNNIVVNWMSDEPGDSLVHFGLTAQYGETVRVDESTTLHHVKIPLQHRDTVYHYSVSTGDQRSANATFKAYPTDVLRVAVVADWQGKPDLSALVKDDIHLLLTAGDNIASLFTLALPVAVSGMDEIEEVSDARRDNDGFLVHTVKSPYQAGETDIRVLLPDRLEEGKRYPVVYVLPVEPERGTRYGDGLLEVQKHDLHNKHRAIFVAPTFSDWPWYADHPTKPEIRQETYFTKVVVPFVEKTYPASGERLLLGFSKSGWGAWTLLLRHPQTFHRAAAWDAPLMMDEIGKYGTGDILGTQENFGGYRPADLLRANAEAAGSEKRLILTGYGNFREHHQQAHTLLNDLKIPHEYRDGPARKHDWHSGWVPNAIKLLVRQPSRTSERQP